MPKSFLFIKIIFELITKRSKLTYFNIKPTYSGLKIYKKHTFLINCGNYFFSITVLLIHKNAFV